ncbi:hypothetical protein [uncultured Chitinophaga sp.]|jgi:hypothetical protein|uniref:hypothetical protein n=1 Tax=uncultured Chitinophaga sp. TaxID=339340 RepID=UPI0026157029|nr:hypothetical protein [uncultured Chitinophaga sp.]
MGLKKWLFSSMFLRNMLADFGFRSAYSTQKGGFVPYFQYIIGPYEQNYYLYFREEPFVKRYKNEIFNKLFEYDRNDSKKYLTFHYDAYLDKQDFLQFLQDEIFERLERRPRSTQKSKLQAALDWVTEKLQEHRTKQEIMIRQEFKQGVQTIIESQQVRSPEETDQQINAVLERIVPSIEKLFEGVTGRIKLSHPKYLDLLLQHLYILRNLQYTDRTGKVKGELFNNFTATDLAFLLRFHFIDFKGQRPNTVQQGIAKVEENIDINSEKFKRLNKALREFYFDN